MRRFFSTLHPEALLIGISSCPASLLPCFHSHAFKTEKIHHTQGTGTGSTCRMCRQHSPQRRKCASPKSSLLSQLSPTDVSPVHSTQPTHQRNRADERKGPHIVYRADAKHSSTRGMRKRIDFSPEGVLPKNLGHSPQPT